MGCVTEMVPKMNSLWAWFGMKPNETVRRLPRNVDGVGDVMSAHRYCSISLTSCSRAERTTWVPPSSLSGGFCCSQSGKQASSCAYISRQCRSNGQIGSHRLTL